MQREKKYQCSNKSCWIVVKYERYKIVSMVEQLKGWVSAKKKEEKIVMQKELEISKSKSIEVSVNGNDCGACVVFLTFFVGLWTFEN